MSPSFKIGHQHHIFATNGVGDRFGCHQHLNKWHLHPFFVINIQKLSPTSTCHQHRRVTNMPLAHLTYLRIFPTTPFFRIDFGFPILNETIQIEFPT